MDKIKVSVVKCDSYSSEILDLKLGNCLDMLNNFNDIIKPDKKILIKPNLLSPSEPEKAITTHPLFIESIVKKILEITNQPENIILADSFAPVLPYTKNGIKKLYGATGIINLHERTGIILNYDNRQEKVSVTDGIAVKQIDIIKSAAKADIIINIPKLKTHNLTIATGAVKNMFGVIPGMAKPGFHTRFFDNAMFCNLLIDIVCALKPQLTIMDGILGMEGNGPGNGGIPRKTNLILASTDCFALDNIASNIMGLDEDNNPVLIEAKKRKIKGAFYENINLIGGNLADFKIYDFLLPSITRKELSRNFFARLMMEIAKNSLNPYPEINRKKCRGESCKTCQKICPQVAISDSKHDNNILLFDYKKCIRCFCCSEVCPEGAIENKYTFLGNLIVNKYGLGGKRGK
ncbi:MAG: DUF362 domain-containing protein [Actinobacteria bacterium]|nr:DUF362 domain-containing protein [Cyanobacteriota bacterium]MCL6087321.1 DUF362 domain-containing protein [Actinomycetota bacterium]